MKSNGAIDTGGADLLITLVYGESTTLITDLVPGGVAASALVLAELAKAQRVKEVFFEGVEEDDRTVTFLAVEDPSATMDRTANRVLSSLINNGYSVSEALVISTIPIFDASRNLEVPIGRLRSGMADVVLGKRSGSYAELSVLSVINSVHNIKDFLGLISGLIYDEEIGKKLHSRSHVWSGLSLETTVTVNSILSGLFDVTFEKAK